MKQVNLVFMLILLLLPLSVNAKSDTSGGSKKTSTSSGFKGGFSSQKKSAPQSAGSGQTQQGGKKVSLDKRSAAAEQRNGATASSSSASGNAGKPAGFGSFGAKNDAPVNLQKSTSKLSVDLSKGNANQNALKTLDARNAAQAAAAAPPPVPAAPSMPATMPQRQPQQPIIVQQQESGILSNPALWFMLGKSLNERPRERPTEYGNNGNGTGSNFPVGNRGAVPAQSPQAQESLGWSALRIVLWLAIFSALGGTVYYFVKRGKGGKTSDSAPSANYSLRDG